jgi:O-antigen/teichoic acid export membrane protein
MSVPKEEAPSAGAAPNATRAGGRRASSRTARALWAAGFSYGQFAIALVAGICLMPLILRCLGRRNYGLWLAGGELLQYMALADGGIFALLPWVLAQADGAREVAAVRRYLANALVIGLGVAVFILLGTFAAWGLLADRVGLAATDRTLLQGPLLVLAGATAVFYPLRIFTALLTGLQDVLFAGWLQLLMSVTGVALSVSLLLAGFGLYAVALAAAVPPVLGGLAALVRTAFAFPELLRGWPSPSWQGVRGLFVQGLGTWISSFGVQLLAASNGLILTYLGQPESMAVYACTAKAPMMLLQLSWVMPDSALVGLAQLHGEAEAGRTRGVVLRLYQLSLLLAGTAACVVLAANPSFVLWWLGPDLFGGLTLNTLLATNLLAATLTHATVTTVAVLGARLQIGLATLLNGVVYVALAVPLGAWLGLPGLVTALLLAGLLTSLAWGLFLQDSTFGLTARDLAASCLVPWGRRMLPALAATGLLGVTLTTRPFWQTLAVSVPCGLLYLWWVRSLWLGLPIPPRFLRWLQRLGRLRVFFGTGAE